jgi:hypothetical protein
MRVAEGRAEIRVIALNNIKLWETFIPSVEWKAMSDLKERMRHFCTPIKGKLVPVRFEVFTAVIMKNGVFWDVTQSGSCKNRR